MSWEWEVVEEEEIGQEYDPRIGKMVRVYRIVVKTAEGGTIRLKYNHREREEDVKAKIEGIRERIKRIRRKKEVR